MILRKEVFDRCQRNGTAASILTGKFNVYATIPVLAGSNAALLNRDSHSLACLLGRAKRVLVDDKLECTMVFDGPGESQVTVLVGAATAEVVDERERMARDAAAAVQAAIKGGVVPGGGAVEVWLASRLENLARQQEGLISYGILCVKEALLKTFLCMAANAGFNSLEKLGDVIAGQRKQNSNRLSFDVNSGQLGRYVGIRSC